MARLYEQLKSYSQSDYYPFHMPGHKRNKVFLEAMNVAELDITEIDGFDNMHRPEGIIREAEERAAALYGAKETRFLVNGSSTGNMAAIMGCVAAANKRKVLVTLNCHKSVYHALELARCEAVYMAPEMEPTLGIYGEVSPQMVKRQLEADNEVAAVVITSPTYEGIVSDVRSIAEIAHGFGVPLIVDEAHGAHFGLNPDFPETAVRQGADLVIQSLHKTMPCLTQTALLHINLEKGSCKEHVLKYYSYLQTTSPSYVMMASVDACISLMEQQSEALFAAYKTRLARFEDRCRGLHYVKVMRCGNQDMSKLVIYLNPVRSCGKWLYDLLLNKYHLQMEMASRDYVLAMTSICDTDEGFERLYQALAEIDQMELPVFETYPLYGTEIGLTPELSIYETTCRETESVQLMQSAGRISCEFAYIYPPGVPMIIPGVRISESALKTLATFAAKGFVIEGLRDMGQEQIEVIRL